MSKQTKSPRLFATMLRTEREAAGLTMRELADRLGYERHSLIGQWEGGYCLPTPGRCVELARALAGGPLLELHLVACMVADRFDLPDAVPCLETASAILGRMAHGAIQELRASKADPLSGLATLQELGAQAEAVGPPAVEWTVSGDVMRAWPPGAYIHVEREDEDTARATLRAPGALSGERHIADVTVHLAPLSDDLGDEARQICQALYWSWWRAQSTKPVEAPTGTSQADPRLVFIASPLRGDMERNMAYARAAMFDSLIRDESPFVPHLLYPQVLDDTIKAQRYHGRAAANRWLLRCGRLVAYVDLGVSSGMQAEIDLAERHGIPVERRRLGGEWEGSAIYHPQRQKAEEAA